MRRIGWGSDTKSGPLGATEAPLSTLQREMNQLFDSFFGSTGLSPAAFSGLWTGDGPKVDVTESDKAVEVTAELPGLNEADVDVELSEHSLRIRGHKKDERTESGHRFHRVERTFGEFERVIPLPVAIERDKVDATFKAGVLTIKLPKSTASDQQKIAIRST